MKYNVICHVPTTESAHQQHRRRLVLLARRVHKAQWHAYLWGFRKGVEVFPGWTHACWILFRVPGCRRSDIFNTHEALSLSSCKIMWLYRQNFNFLYWLSSQDFCQKSQTLTPSCLTCWTLCPDGTHLCTSLYGLVTALSSAGVNMESVRYPDSAIRNSKGTPFNRGPGS